MEKRTEQDIEAAVERAKELMRQGRYAEALKILLAAISDHFFAASERVQRPTPAALLAIEQLADIAYLFSEWEASDSLLKSLASWYEKAGNRYYGDYIAAKRIHLALGRDALDDALSLLRNLAHSIGDVFALDISPAGLERWERTLRWPGAKELDRAILLSRLYLAMGRILSGYGQFGDSITIFTRGLVHAQRSAKQAGSHASLHLRLSIALALLEKGELVEARSALEALHPDLDETTQPGLSVRWLEASGKLDLLTGEFGQAVERFRRIIEFCRVREFSRAALVAALNLAHVLIYLNQTYAAKEMLKAVGAAARTLNDQEVYQRALLLSQVAEARGSSLADEVPIAPSVIEMWNVVDRRRAEKVKVAPAADPADLTRPEDYLTFFDNRALAFHWRLGLRDYAGASRALGDMEDLFRLSDSLLVQTRLKTLRATLTYYQDDGGGNQIEWAEELLRSVRPTMAGLRLKPELWQAQRFLGWCWTKLRRDESEIRALSEDTERLLDEITQSLDPADRAIFRLNKWTAEEEYIANEINKLAHMQRNLEAGARILRPRRRWQLMKGLHRLSLFIDRYKDALARRQVGGANRGEARPRHPSLLRRLLRHPRDRATISFLVLPDRVFVMRASWLSLDFKLNAVTRVDLRNLIRSWHEPLLKFAIAARGLGALSDDCPREQKEAAAREKEEALKRLLDINHQQEIAGELAERLRFSSLLAELPSRVTALTLIPDDSLHGFPFAAIMYKGEYLIKHYALSMAFESENTPRATRTDQNGPLVVGVSKEAGKLPELDGASEEIGSIESWLKAHCDQRPLRLDDISGGKWPDKATVSAALAKANLFHIACHGIFKPDEPDASGLVLVPAPGRVEVLSLRDLSSMNLLNLRHVTLSSCWSADHFVLPGRWVIGLPETFWRSGAASVIASLWVVEDKFGASFMSELYKKMERMPRDQALWQTQLDCLSKKIPGNGTADQDNPVYWAGYCLYGDHTRLNL